MQDDDLTRKPLATETFTVADVRVEQQVREHDGYFKIDRYVLSHRKHEGGWTAPASREIFERGHAAAVLLYDPHLERMLFIEQFRPGAYAAFNSPWFDQDRHSPWLLECVAGIIDEGESPEDVARREALEEANCHVLDLHLISHYLVSPGGTTESVFLYCGRVDAQEAGGVHGLEAEGEDIRVLNVSTATALAWLEEGRFVNSMILIAMQWFRIHRDDLRAMWLSR